MVFNFQISLSIEAINNETKALDRKAHLFWKFPDIVKRICEFVDYISISGNARRKIFMTGDTKDSKTFYSVKNTMQKKTSSGN